MSEQPTETDGPGDRQQTRQSVSPVTSRTVRSTAASLSSYSWGTRNRSPSTAAVLGSMYAIEFRGNSQADVEALAQNAGVPVYNGLTGDCRFNMGCLQDAPAS